MLAVLINIAIAIGIRSGAVPIVPITPSSTSPSSTARELQDLLQKLMLLERRQRLIHDELWIIETRPIGGPLRRLEPIRERPMRP